MDTIKIQRIEGCDACGSAAGMEPDQILCDACRTFRITLAGKSYRVTREPGWAFRVHADCPNCDIRGPVRAFVRDGELYCDCGGFHLGPVSNGERCVSERELRDIMRRR